MSLDVLWIQFFVFLYAVQYILSIMSGESPNSDAFDFIDGRSSPAATTSKDAIVSTSALVEPGKEDVREDNKRTDKDKEEPDFSSPTLNSDVTDHRRNGEREKAFGDGDLRGSDHRKEAANLLNGGPDVVDQPKSPPEKDDSHENQDDSCIVNCLYYTMECCQCTII